MFFKSSAALLLSTGDIDLTQVIILAANNVAALLASAQQGSRNDGYGYYDGNYYYSPSGSSNVIYGNNGYYSSFLNGKRPIVIAHGVLAAAAFLFFFPVGAILVRLGNFRGLWLVHAIIQAFAYLLYIAAFGLGIWMAMHSGLLRQTHPIIGIVLFILIFFQPFLGLAHHFMFKKHSRRVVWSYGHIWLGRIIITLGIINGGLGLQLARRTRYFSASGGAIIAYLVIAIVVWLTWVVAIIVGETRRSRLNRQGPQTEAPAIQESQAATVDARDNKTRHVYA